MSGEKAAHIPRHAGAGVSFAGAEVEDAWILMAGVVLAVIAGGFLGMGTIAYLGFPAGAYVLNKMYVDWKTAGMPGQLRARLYHLGLGGYSTGFPKQDMVYVGDAQPGNLDSKRLVAERMRRMQAVQLAVQKAVQPAVQPAVQKAGEGGDRPARAMSAVTLED